MKMNRSEVRSQGLQAEGDNDMKFPWAYCLGVGLQRGVHFFLLRSMCEVLGKWDLP